MSAVPLSVLDLVPVSSGSTAAAALHATVDLAQRAERAGYARYWLAEHHLNPGVAGSAPTVVIGAVAATTSSIRVGSAATLVGNVRGLQIAETFGTLAALHGPRIDLGLGRSGAPAPGTPKPPSLAPRADEVVDGLLVPAPFDFRIAAGSRFALQGELLGRVPGDVDRFEGDLELVRALFAGTWTRDGALVEAPPATGAPVELWIHGSTGGESARIAGALGLPYGANYHTSPGTVLASVEAYREAFRPGVLDAPHVIVSADVVVGRTADEASELALGYGQWVWSIRSGVGAIAYPTPDEARARPLDDEAAAAVADRLATRFVGDASHVADRLETLRRVTGADELLVTTITHDHEARVRSYELLADEWARRAEQEVPAAV
ncbi:alkanesulfonate monooxygenase SsuD/methylene tetrahydromethanopterin reductase-like flavin-dependent oxidoreductase (luciferase family) [Curtobacterium luteum]|uniref:Alkanesulfonate monooxygenase SsuD/methylene tetrahydromethanopterin reductase-like flavin-dependent oxidoreductase (Luciferase family) n=2 Tax=Curtobacterium TaxID=2034 RepID=A0A8H9GAY6_9MICO|nr:LLM class flavin-dependent oxidoreductase [Curtobacterium luteum]MBM7801365.1 alkanesulfonate monooxygenase SsuD/methylene tetrahydromethanopterin reductase-like flavin-dependent oxidoreductase (luciferase family) [Curtobacterium luteum]NUU49862.1 LLM class flavin-dependent oxidoreductase [Curtobacterium luteum]GGK91034.1 putative monooxygenase (luciferase-like) [Curtobacterium luteum]